MFISSMTGFARSTARYITKRGEINWVWEIRSVNARNLEVRLKLPQGYDSLAQEIREQIAGKISRGSVNVTLELSKHEELGEFKINDKLLDGLIQEASRIHLSNPDIFNKISLDNLFQIRGVLEISEDFSEEEKESFLKNLLSSFSPVLDDFVKSRKEEGTRIKDFISTELKELDDNLEKARALTVGMTVKIREKLTKDLIEVLKGLSEVTEERVIQEASIIAIKADVKEELDRLSSHIVAADKLLKEGGNIGRKFDFIAQEMLREANTLCSKSADIELTYIGLAMKSVIDQIKEQIQNLE